MLGGIVIANYVHHAVTTDSETSIHRGKGHNLFICLLMMLTREYLYVIVNETKVSHC